MMRRVVANIVSVMKDNGNIFTGSITSNTCEMGMMGYE
jgi:hypothetical protein